MAHIRILLQALVQHDLGEIGIDIVTGFIHVGEPGIRPAIEQGTIAPGQVRPVAVQILQTGLPGNPGGMRHRVFPAQDLPGLVLPFLAPAGDEPLHPEPTAGVVLVPGHLLAPVIDENLIREDTDAQFPPAFISYTGPAGSDIPARNGHSRKVSFTEMGLQPKRKQDERLIAVYPFQQFIEGFFSRYGLACIGHGERSLLKE